MTRTLTLAAGVFTILIGLGLATEARAQGITTMEGPVIQSLGSPLATMFPVGSTIKVTMSAALGGLVIAEKTGVPANQAEYLLCVGGGATGSPPVRIANCPAIFFEPSYVMLAGFALTGGGGWQGNVAVDCAGPGGLSGCASAVRFRISSLSATD
jgi:hypothetical protein